MLRSTALIARRWSLSIHSITMSAVARMSRPTPVNMIRSKSYLAAIV